MTFVHFWRGNMGDGWMVVKSEGWTRVNGEKGWWMFILWAKDVRSEGWGVRGDRWRRMKKEGEGGWHRVTEGEGWGVMGEVGWRMVTEGEGGWTGWLVRGLRGEGKGGWRVWSEETPASSYATVLGPMSCTRSDKLCSDIFSNWIFDYIVLGIATFISYTTTRKNNIWRY